MTRSGRATKTSILPLLFAAVALLGLLSPWIVSAARRAQIDASMDVFLAADARSRGSLEQLETVLPERTACLVLLRFEGIFSDEGAQLVHELGGGRYDLGGIARVFSLTRARRPIRSKGFGLSLTDLIDFEPFLPLDPQSEEAWRTLEPRVTNFPWARDLLVSKDGKWTMLVAEIARDLREHSEQDRLRREVEEVVAPFRARTEELHVGSFPFIEVEIRDDLREDARRFLLVLPLLLAAILLATFRSWQVLACVLVFETIGVGLLLMAFRIDGSTINIYTGILFPLIAGLQLTFLTHFFATLRWALRRSASLADALPVALRHVLRPSAIAALTTVIGLSSLLVCDVGLVRDFGRLGSLVLIAVFAATFGPLAALARLLGRGGREPSAPLHADDGTDAVGERVAGWFASLGRRRALVIGGACLLLAAALPALSRVRTDLRAIEFLSPESAARRTMSAVDEHMGGMNLFELVVDCGSPGGIQDPESLAFLERVESFAVARPGVTNVYGYAQIYALLNEIWQREAPGSRKVPRNTAAIAAIGAVVHDQEFLFAESMFDAERRKTTLFIRTRDMPASEYLTVLEQIVAYAEATRPEHVTIEGKAGLHSVLESDRRIVGSQVKSLLLCLAAVFATLTLLWRSPRLAVVALLVNVPSLAAVLALHGYGGIPLNSVTVMVGAVVLGIAVDNSIHVLSFWREERARFADSEACLRWVLRHKLVPMACTTAVLASGFGLFLASSFPPIEDFGVLSIAALATALAAGALLLPALLSALFGDRAVLPDVGR